MQEATRSGSAGRRRPPATGAPGLVLYFAPGARPDPAALAAGASGFALAPDAGAAGAPVELRAAGLPFAALGLAPGP
ncbi:hypothetical protein H7F53_05200, partial [Novosphingobium piscinae]